MVACTFQLHSMNVSPYLGRGQKGATARRSDCLACGASWGRGVGTGTDKATRRSGEIK